MKKLYSDKGLDIKIVEFGGMLLVTWGQIEFIASCLSVFVNNFPQFYLLCGSEIPKIERAIEKKASIKLLAR